LKGMIPGHKEKIYNLGGNWFLITKRGGNPVESCEPYTQQRKGKGISKSRNGRHLLYLTVGFVNRIWSITVKISTGNSFLEGGGMDMITQRKREGIAHLSWN